MRMKSLLAASTALALVTAAPGAQAGDLYVSVFGGANFLADDSAVADESDAWGSDADTGFVLGGAVGTHLDKWATGLKVELEASYRRNDIGGHWSDPPGEIGFLTGNGSTFSIMANAWYEFDIGSKARPYIGGGAGWSRFKGDMIAQSTDDGFVTDSDMDTDMTNSGFSWQLGLGFHYEVAPGVDAGLGYRYFKGPDFAFYWEGDRQTLDNENHAVQVDLTIDIN